LPAVLSVSGGSNIRRFPSIGDVVLSSQKTIDSLGFNEIGCEHGKVGLEGSPTKVVKIKTVAADKKGDIFFAENDMKEALLRFKEMVKLK